MAETSWNEVGERFSRLGRTLAERWSDGSAEASRSEDEVRGAMDGVMSSLDSLADTITRTVNDGEVHDSARSAAGGLVEALSASLSKGADRIQQRGGADEE